MTEPADPIRAILEGPRRGWTPLMDACADADRRADALALLDAGADPDEVAEDAECALGLAVRGPGALALVERLLAAGARCVADIDGNTALVAAIERGNLDILRILAESSPPESAIEHAFGYACVQGAIDAVRMLWEAFPEPLQKALHGDRNTPLMASAAAGQIEVMRFLLDQGADIDEFDLKEDLSPLMYAVQARQHAAVRFLVERGANVDAQTEWFVTPLSLARKARDPEMIALLLDSGAQDEPDQQMPPVVLPWGTYPPPTPPAIRPEALHLAAAGDDVEAIRRLLAGGASVGEIWRGTTALAWAARSNARRAAQTLLSAGADPLAGSPSAFAWALSAGSGRIARAMLQRCEPPMDIAISERAVAQPDPWLLSELLDRGAPLEGSRMGSLLQQAISRHLPHHVALLCKHGANIHACSATGAPPLLQAARDLQVVRALLRAGAPVEAADSRGERPLLRAAGHPELVALLLEHGADPDALDDWGRGWMYHAAERGSPRGLALALSRVPHQLALRDRDGRVPLHAAARHASAVRVLLDAGADVDPRDGAGQTPLFVAAVSAPEAAALLLAAGADPRVHARDGRTPLHLAATYGQLDTVEQLLAAGADREARDLEGKTPAERAVEGSRPHWVSAAQRAGALAAAERLSAPTPRRA